MSILSNYSENKAVDHMLGTASYTPEATLYLALFTGDPGEADATTNEVTGGSYARVAITNNATNFPACAVTGVPTKLLATAAIFPTASSAWGTITHWGIFNALTGGTNKIAQGALAFPRTISAGNTPRFAASSISITATNAAGGGMTDFAKRKVLDLFFGAHAYTAPAAIYCSLCTAATGETLTEWTGDTYSRPQVEFTAASGGISANTNTELFTSGVTTSANATITHYGLHDDPTTGTLLFYGPLSTSRTVATGDTATAAAGALTVTFQ